LRRFLPRPGTQLAQQQEAFEAQLLAAVAEGEVADEIGDGNGEDVIDVGDGIDGGGEGSMMEGDADVDEGIR